MVSASDASVLFIQQLATVSKPLVTYVCGTRDRGDHRRVDPLELVIVLLITASLLGALVRGEKCILKNKRVKVRREIYFW
jgi:hypothetical protein